MVSRIEIRSITFIDIDKAINWYEREVKGLGKRFLKEVEATFTRVATNPHNYLIISVL